MKYKLQITINRPIDRVVEFFEDPNHMKEWQQEMSGYDVISGVSGRVGLKLNLMYELVDHQEVVTYTLIGKEPMSSLTILLEQSDNKTTQINNFEKIDDNATKLTQKCSVRFVGLKSLVGFISIGSKKSRSLRHLESFKNLLERI